MCVRVCVCAAYECVEQDLIGLLVQYHKTYFYYYYYSGKCEKGGWSHEEPCGFSNIVYHKCDTTGGHSGAALYDSEGNVFGVHTGGSHVLNVGYAFSESSFVFTLSNSP